MNGTSEDMPQSEEIRRILEENQRLKDENSRYLTRIDELERLTERFELAIKGTSDGLWDWNLASNEIYFSPRWKAMLGYREDELQNELSTWSELVHPDDLDEATNEIDISLKNPAVVYEHVYRLRHKDGHYIWNLDRGQVLFDAAGRAIRMIGFHTDISMIKALEEKLSVLKTAMDHAPLSFVITDKEGNIEYANPWFSEVTGYTLEEAIGQNPRILRTGYTSEEEYQALWSEITHDHLWRGIFKNLRKNGETYWESATIVPVKNHHGTIIHYLGIKQEITEEKHLKELLVQKDAHIQSLATILDEAKIEIYIFDSETLSYLYANKSAYANTLYTHNEMLQLKPTELNRISVETLRDHIKRIDAEKTTVMFEMTHYRKDGSSYPVNIVLQHGIYNDHDVYVAMVADITELKAMMQEVQSTQEIMIAQSRHAAMGEMIGMIAHQWRQPLSIISMIVNNITMDIELDELNPLSCRSSSESILLQVNHLSKTIDDFRDFFRPDKQRETIKIVDIINEACAMINASFDNNDITLEIENNSEKIISTYSRELLQVIINLLKNSKEALLSNRRSARRMSIRIYDEADEVVADFCDNAGGIAPEILPRIYDPYFSTKDEKTGTGLGLYMSKTIIEKHLKGMISAYNSDVGVCFSIRLPHITGK